MVNNITDNVNNKDNLNNKDKVPDYRITGLIFGPKQEKISLSLYIKESKKVDATLLTVKGTIDNHFWTGEFDGEISDTIFSVNVRYDEEAIKNGAPITEIRYFGLKKKEAYVGSFSEFLQGIEIPRKYKNSFGAKKYNAKNLTDVLHPEVKIEVNSSWN